MTKTDNKITLVNTKFSQKACKIITLAEIHNSSDTARDLFYFAQSFGNRFKVQDIINLWTAEDPIQNLNTVTCGIFQIYTFDNLLNPDKHSKIQGNKKLTKKKQLKL